MYKLTIDLDDSFVTIQSTDLEQINSVAKKVSELKVKKQFTLNAFQAQAIQKLATPVKRGRGRPRKTVNK